MDTDSRTHTSLAEGIVLPGASGTGHVVAVDVGGTTIKAARIGPDGTVLTAREVATGTGEAAVSHVISLCHALVTPDTAAVGLAAPGLVDATSGVVRYAANLGWRGVPLRDLVRRAVDVPVALDQDVRAAGKAVATLDSYRSTASLLLVVLGTGVGATVVLGQRPIVGNDSMAGELGHAIVHPGGDNCPCGQSGCLEAYASASAIARRFHAAGGDPRYSSKEIAMSTDALARQVWQQAADALGLALATVTLLVDPATIVLAGGLSLAGDRLVHPVREALQSRLTWRDAPPVSISPLGSRAGQTGAALLAWERAGHTVPGPGWKPELATMQ